MNLSSAARIARSSLSSVTGEMSVLSRNIAGAGTDLSSRKIVNVVSTGSGSQLGTVTRASNLAAFAKVLGSTASAAEKNALAAGLDQLATTLGDSTTATGSPADLLSKFTDSLQAYSSSPSDSIAATNVVASAKALANALNSASGLVQGERAQADSDMAQSVQTIDSLLRQFQALNAKVVKGTGTAGDVTDVLDQRDAILEKLSNEIGISTFVDARGDMSIYTDSGVTLFQGGSARLVVFEATSNYTASTNGNRVYIDGVPVTGSSAPMAIGSGKLAGAAALRDDIGVTYQAQLDGIAGALISVFAESDQVGSGPDLPGLFTTPGAVALPTTTAGVAASVSVSPSVDPMEGGDAKLLRDGGISGTGNPGYSYNTNDQASYSGRITELLDKLASTRSFGSEGRIDTAATIDGYATASVSWLSAERSKVGSERDYQDILLNAATSAFSDATGVDLDTEISKMLGLEQSYSATAKLITTVNDMFSALINAV
jgi:flagellar hook-associated protein 1 FlgK